MVDRHDMLRYERIAQHASVGREKSQISEARVHSSHAEPSTSRAHVSPHVLKSSSRRTQVHLLTRHSLHPPACAKFHLFRR